MAGYEYTLTFGPNAWGRLAQGLGVQQEKVKAVLLEEATSIQKKEV